MKFGEYEMSMNPVYADISIDEVIEKHNGMSFGEIKEDGYRCQVHADKDFIRMFTRAGNEYVYECYPEIVDAVKNLKLDKAVLDAEIKGENIGYEGFIQIRKRFRRTEIKGKKIEEYKKLMKDYPLRLVIFDTLMVNGKGLVDTKLSERRGYTESIFGKRVTPSELHRITSEKQFDQLFEEKVKKMRHEGFVLKNPSSSYLGKPKELNQKDEDYNWVKVKNFETLDLVVIGLIEGNREYASGLKYVSAICAMKNNKTGLYDVLGSVSLARKNPATDNSFGIDLERMIKKFSKNRPENIYFPEKLEKKCLNVNYVKPDNSQVIAVKAMNIEFDKKDYTFRIAHISDIREDKSIKQATTLKEVEEIYKVQKGKEDKK